MLTSMTQLQLLSFLIVSSAPGIRSGNPIRDRHFPRDNITKHARFDFMAAGDLLKIVIDDSRVCSKMNERIGLALLVAPFHGSSALESLLMSSPHVGTVCRSLTW
jgi:hypothetical protein